MGRTLSRVGVAMAVAVLWVTMGAGSDAAPLVDAASVAWSIETGPTCPSLHADSINGGQGLYDIQLIFGPGDQFYDVGADVRPGQPFVLDLSPTPEATIHGVVIYNIDVGFQAAQWQDVQVFCTGATAPLAPRQGVATPGNQSATVSWLSPLSNGGAPIQYYDVNAYIGDTPVTSTRVRTSGNGTATFPLLTNGVEYRFDIRAYNDIGYSPISNVQRSITVGTPTAPTIGAATAGAGSATVSWTPPTTDNGSPILAYVVTAYVGFDPMVSVLAGPNVTSRTIPGLTAGTTYKIRVRPHNARGAGLFSTVSNPVTPA